MGLRITCIVAVTRITVLEIKADARFANHRKAAPARV
jgi:hypothetical protein